MATWYSHARCVRALLACWQVSHSATEIFSAGLNVGSSFEIIELLYSDAVDEGIIASTARAMELRLTQAELSASQRYLVKPPLPADMRKILHKIELDLQDLGWWRGSLNHDWNPKIARWHARMLSWCTRKLRARTHAKLLDAAIAMFALGLPPYILLWITDWAFPGPPTGPLERYKRVRLLEGVRNSIRKVRGLVED